MLLPRALRLEAQLDGLWDGGLQVGFLPLFKSGQEYCPRFIESKKKKHLGVDTKAGDPNFFVTLW